MEHGRQYCTFQLDGWLLGVPIERVQEVIRPPETTGVPLAPRAVSGLINLRGEIVTAIDLRRRFGAAARTDDAETMNVVLRHEEGAVALRVDAIGDVLEVTADRFRTPPPTLTGPAHELVRGVYELDDGLLLVLDTERAVEGMD
ncbi:MAG TPA: chemotaxis protein CheW [Sandaracinaceae bacterium LLY-WYZ-13_1]|nr:chemotaxis protein CheW [Sandaracinaceae bacterium LLY-WYZ-13_1]